MALMGPDRGLMLAELLDRLALDQHLWGASWGDAGALKDHHKLALQLARAINETKFMIDEIAQEDS